MTGTHPVGAIAQEKVVPESPQAGRRRCDCGCDVNSETHDESEEEADQTACRPTDVPV